MPNEETVPKAPPTLAVAVEALERRLDRIEKVLESLASPHQSAGRLIEVIEKLDKDTTSLFTVMDTLHKQREEMTSQGREIDMVKTKAGSERKRVYALGLVILLLSVLLYGVNAAQRSNSCQARNAQTQTQSEFIIGMLNPAGMSSESSAVVNSFLEKNRPLDCGYWHTVSGLFGQ